MSFSLLDQSTILIIISEKIYLQFVNNIGESRIFSVTAGCISPSKSKYGVQISYYILDMIDDPVPVMPFHIICSY